MRPQGWSISRGLSDQSKGQSGEVVWGISVFYSLGQNRWTGLDRSGLAWLEKKYWQVWQTSAGGADRVTCQVERPEGWVTRGGRGGRGQREERDRRKRGSVTGYTLTRGVAIKTTCISGPSRLQKCLWSTTLQKKTQRVRGWQMCTQRICDWIGD